MVIEIRRYHILIVACFSLLLAHAVIFSKETQTTLKDEIIPAQINQPSPIEQKQMPQDIKLKAIVKKPQTLSKIPKKITSIDKVQFPKTLAVTFDDGPHPQHTERLLTILKDSGIRATFFVVGSQVEQYPELLKMISKDGHEIANHTYSHPDLRNLSNLEITQELYKTENLIFSVTGKKTKYFRPPGGRYNREVVKAAKANGYEMILWSVLPEDHARPSAKLIRSRVLSAVKNGSIVLLHSGVESTMDSLPGMIKTLKKRGFEFKTVSQIRSAKSPATLARIK